MGRAKIKKKSTFIDMTAMSDVTVLLLTFFMLTSTFVKKEPVQVFTPASDFRNQDSGNEYPSDFGGSARENIYEPRQTARYEGCIGEDG